MENDDSRWTEERLASLEPPATWTPDTVRAMARFRARRRAWRRGVAGVVCGTLAAGIALMVLMALSAPQACATPTGCAEHFWNRVFQSQPDAAPKPVAEAPDEFRKEGSPSAPIVCELYSDYECPGCAAFFRDVLPRLRADYIATGKLRLIHRDFPLPRHRYSRLAARYADAAGRLGHYQAAVDRLFATQAAWSELGNIDEQLAAVLTPKELERVRQMVEHDPSLDASVAADVSLGAADHIRGTPSLIVIHKGKREEFFPAPNYDLLRGYLDALTAP